MCLECSQLDIVSILEFLLPKYASFQTRPLLSALRELFRALCNADRDTFISTVTRGLNITVSHVIIKANAVSNYFTLLDWVNEVLLLSSGDNKSFTKHLPDLVIWQATLLQGCLAESKKKGLKVSAIRMTRASLRGIFQRKEITLDGNTVESVIKVLFGSKIPPFAAAVSLGIVSGVCKRLRNDTSRNVIEMSKTAFYDFFVKEIVGSRVRIPEYVMVHVFSLLY